MTPGKVLKQSGGWVLSYINRRRGGLGFNLIFCLLPTLGGPLHAPQKFCTFLDMLQKLPNSILNFTFTNKTYTFSGNHVNNTDWVPCESVIRPLIQLRNSMKFSLSSVSESLSLLFSLSRRRSLW